MVASPEADAKRGSPDNSLIQRGALPLGPGGAHAEPAMEAQGCAAETSEGKTVTEKVSLGVCTGHTLTKLGKTPLQPDI